MKIAIFCALLCIGLAGCGALQKEVIAPEAARTDSIVPRQPVGYTQLLGNREPYTGTLPYVLCFGLDCDRPTPKTIARAQVRPAVQEQQPVVTIQETRIKESIGFLFNSTELDPDSKPTLESSIQAALRAKEIWIKGYAGLTATNREKEDAVLALALARARHIEGYMKVAGVTAHITVGSELVRCKSEADCLEQFKFGGRRADLEVVIIGDAKDTPQAARQASGMRELQRENDARNAHMQRAGGAAAFATRVQPTGAPASPNAGTKSTAE